MEYMNTSKTTYFYAIGLSYKKADAEIRGHFSLDDQAKSNLLQQAKEVGIESLIVTSTCNRTEIYGFAEHPYQLIKLLCENTKGTVEEFQNVAYIYKGKEAVSHMFKVGSGLDSQILGDFEIISQLKNSARNSKKEGLLNAFVERLINAVIQASKRIKTETNISSGATSVSFASVQYIMSNVPDVTNKNILLFGTGKIGRNTCENLVKHTKNKHITLINRTKNKAEEVAGKFNLLVKDYANLQEEINQTDVLIVATGAQNPTVDKHLIQSKKPLLILDLSIPRNVHLNVLELEHVSLIHLDDLSQITDETLEKRKAQIPIAKQILNEVEAEFNSWLETRKFAPTIKALKLKLNDFKIAELDTQRKKLVGFNEEQAEIISNNIIQKITNHFAHHLKDDAIPTDESLELIKKVFQLEATTNHV
ncbi:MULTISPECIES: glutamyl-tRNA reductase [Xanthomarina]|jgi:glutamyl-tRNA reductase|uniref:Glutamyl-tRNA reductase n=1 Tax=Xanthomarina gelatinilytica TaxID=1137281 RepID=A0A3D6BTA3_9FLAO|nr:glutamyl-tRNA reductase [Xanthomarina sp.]MAL21852.1 glutamyl-tRNA reductase [Xanthomarina sp.]MCB0387212.1 glutamyl-tRNA reductase [Winogradskyella sp.]MDX1315904.1 glutamyl-tRNA reductase [Xanthomarina gelatinilytica]HCY81255.1 glutamyl-tRNA reductase [Xanthomarina gelatinilytica]